MSKIPFEDNFTRSIKTLKYTETRRELDDKDQHILYWLMRNARMPLTEISKNTGINKDTIKYRIVKLIDDGVINGFSVIVDFGKLGYGVHIIFMKIRNFNKEFEGILDVYIDKNPAIWWAEKLSGRWDLCITFISLDVWNYRELLSNIKKFMGEQIDDHEVTQIYNDYKVVCAPFCKYIKPDDRFPSGRISEKSVKDKTIDEMDIKILRLLGKNCRISNINIGELLGISHDVVRDRIKRMEKSGVLRGYMCVMNPWPANYDLYILNLKLTANMLKEKKQEFLRYLVESKNTLAVEESGDKWSFFLFILARNPGEYNEILLGIRTKFSDIITDFESMIVIKEYKYNEFPEKFSASEPFSS